ncbi:MAG: 2-amino-4-hydroxy-6-hydroxymethyldihydropteridine diphosphokinase [Nitrospinae bacterium]|nr:2-amino-4-hydroxy-6-hydroxymethyldihydropteridine diphosphokinase [Nitrospinota bacterium]
MPEAYLSLGSNVGDRAGYIRAAVELLIAGGGAALAATGRFYETEPVGEKDQPWFVNTAIMIETSMTPEGLLARLKQIEKQMGRIDTGRWGPRVIDMDIIFYDGLVMDTAELKIPHPLAHARRFVMAPLADMAPEFVHPALGRTVKGILSSIADDGQTVRVFKE